MQMPSRKSLNDNIAVVISKKGPMSKKSPNKFCKPETPKTISEKNMNDQIKTGLSPAVLKSVKELFVKKSGGDQ